MVGAVTWGNGNGGTIGTVTASNSLIGSTDGDEVGSGGVTALSNNNYVVSSPNWQKSGAVVGAVTWSKADGSTIGTVSATNSLIGSTNGDQAGLGTGNPGSGVTALANGNYAVNSPNWQKSGAVVGAVTFGKTDGTTVGAVSASNSLVGAVSGDTVGSGGVTALANGSYVVSSPNWQKSGAVVGAVTLAKADGSSVGAVSSGNSLVGATNGDNVGSGGVTVLSNGNYVVGSPNWHNGNSKVGAATWIDGSTGQAIDGTTGIDTLNSLIGAGSGALLQQVFGLPGGAAFLASFSGNGGSVVEQQVTAGSETFATVADQALTVSPTFITDTLNTGTAVVLQASNDITLNSPIVVNNPGGNGGDLTLEAGRNISLFASITTDNGNLTLVANATAADGVVDSQRDSGSAGIIMVAGTKLDVGTGDLSATLDTGAGLTNHAADDITLGTVIAHDVNFVGHGIGVDLASVTASGNVVIHSDGDIIMNGAISAQDPGIINVTGTTSLSAGELIALDHQGNHFGGTVTFAAPTVTLLSAGDLTVASTVAATTLTINADGNLSQSGPLAATGAASFTGGTIALSDAGNSFQGPVTLNCAGAASVTNAGALDVANLAFGGPANLSAPTIAIDGNVNVGSLALSLTSTSAAQLNGSTTLAGGTIADSAGLVFGGNATLSGSGTLQAGTGGAGVLVQSGATVTPDQTPGGLTVNGDVTFATGSILAEQVAGTSQFSKLTVNGAVNLNSPTLQLSVQSPYTPALGDQFQIIAGGTGSTLTGTFAQGSSLVTPSAILSINYASGGNTGVILAVTAIPGVNVVPDPVLVGKNDLVIWGTGNNDTITVTPGKTARGKIATSYAVNFNGTVQTVNNIRAQILVFELGGDNNINLRKVQLPVQFSVGDGNNTLVGGAGRDVFQVGAGNNSLDGGGGVNTLIESGNVDYKLVGGTATTNGSLTKGSAQDTLIKNHMQRVQLSLTGPDGHTIDGTAFAGREIFLGGPGDDTLLAGKGSVVLVGGGGTDKLVGGSGHGVLIAGAGAATITGGNNQDLIIGGTTNYDANVAALTAILTEWASANTYAVKVKHLTGTLRGGKNGNILLTTSTVTNNGQASTLTGGKGQDWFWSSAQDTVTDLFAGVEKNAAIS
jgi:hypothetical protein